MKLIKFVKFVINYNETFETVFQYYKYLVIS